MSMLPDPATGTSPAEAWPEIDHLRLMRRFEESLDYEDATAFVAMQDDLSPDERLLLRFLMATYDHSLHTIDGYCRHIASFLNHTRKSALNVNARDVEAFVRHCRAKGLKPRSINTIIGALKSFFNRLAATGAIPLNPTAFLKRRRTDTAASMPGHLSHSLSESEMAALFDRLAEHQAPERDILLLKTLFMTGLRGEEAVSLRWKNIIEWQGHRYFDVMGKGSKAREPQQVVHDKGTHHKRRGQENIAGIFHCIGLDGFRGAQKHHNLVNVEQAENAQAGTQEEAGKKRDRDSAFPVLMASGAQTPGHVVAAAHADGKGQGLDDGHG